MRWWYRVCLAAPVIGILNMSLISLSAVPVLSDLTGINKQTLAMLLPPTALLLLALIGYLLDHARWPQRQERESVARSPYWGRILDSLERIEAQNKNSRE